jgi:hypothetical protein
LANLAEQVRPKEDKERERQAKIKRMEEIKRKLAEIEKIESAVKTSAQELAEATGDETLDTNAEAAGKMKSVEDLTGQLSSIQGLMEQEFAGEGTEEISPQALSDIENELAKLEEEVATEEEIEVATIYDKILQLYPWISDPRKAFMYAVPPDPKSKDFMSWRQEWSRVIFDFARLSILHVVYVKKLMGEQPFANFRERDKALASIADYLVEQKLANYKSKDKEALRIYWKSHQEWADEVYEWASDNALLDPVLKEDLRAADQPFSTLPDEDLDEVIKILKKQKKISQIKLDSGETAVKFLL